jgi:DNA-binding MarR family transcriptional regulator
VADHIDEVVEAWSRARPGWDLGGMALFARISRIERLVDARRTEVLRPHGLAPADVDVLASLWRHHPAGQRPRDLRRTMLVGSGTLTPRLDRLESEGWLRREPDPDDGRGRVLVLTERSHRRVPALVEELLAVENEALDALPRRARDRLADDLGRLLRSLES